MGFDRNVFVNCPFDSEYLPLLRPLLFTIIYLDLEPKIALQSLNSSEPRIKNIVSLIAESKYAIHDLSRLRAKQKGEFYRLNMPFELGVDVGCQLFGAGKLRRKTCLILEAEKFRYQAAISDLSNSNIGVHGNEPERVVTEVRNWLSAAAGRRAPGPTEIWTAFQDFATDNFRRLARRGYSPADVAALPVRDLIKEMQSWCVRLRARRSRLRRR